MSPLLPQSSLGAECGTHMRSNRMLGPGRLLGAGAILLLMAASAPPAASAQTLSGRLLEEGRETPVAGAVIWLVDRDDRRRAEATSDSLGRFLLTPPEAGEYVVEAVRLGYATTRSPLFVMGVDGSVPFEIMMRPLPVGLEGIEVSVEREAEELLRNFGLTPATLRNRWIDRGDIDAMGMPGLPKDLIRWQNIAGVWVVEMDPTQGVPELCVTFRRGTGCALTVLNGVPISSVEAFYLDPQALEAVAILTPVEATTFFGTGAAGGAVLMWTRRGRR